MATNTCEFVEGRLLEIRVAAGYKCVADIDAMIGMIRGNVGKLPPGDSFTIAADWRAVQVMSPETAQRCREMLASVNPRVVRSAILTLPENSLTNLQVVRLVREAQNPSRRAFTVAAEMAAWLGEVLSPKETARVRVFLA
jgi:hypothetical protein